MDKISITVNGKPYDVRPDTTILEAVQEHQIDRIPTLCHEPKLPPYGSCYLCVVEVEGTKKLIPACSSPVAAGMKIHTDNERIRLARKTALELLLSNHYADCLGPCKMTCPAGVDVQGYIALMAAGKFHEAVRLIKETNPLPLVCGRVCVRECEVACRRNRVDEGVGIDYLKRFATDIDIDDPWRPHVPGKNGKSVAVVGGGPAGLTCAYYLILQGYAVTLFERAPHLGGMLRYGIPEYRLPKALLDKEIRWITDLGVSVKTGCALGKDITIPSLRQQGFAAIFLAFGAQKAKAMRLPDEDKVLGVLPGIDFLWQLQTDKKPEIYGKVVVVGGGNTAIDAARTALRLGAGKSTLLYRRTRHEMPAHHLEIEAALQEGVELVELSAPIRIVCEGNRLKALECIRMELGEPDASGRRSPVPKPGTEYLLPCDFAVSAIGQDVDLCGLAKSAGLEATKHNTLIVSQETLEASTPGIFAGGDMATGPNVAIAAIAHGKIASNSIDHYLRLGKAAVPAKEFLSKKDAFGEIPDSEFAHFPKVTKERMPELSVAERIRSFVEVEKGFSPQQVANETSRCLECGCSAFFDCELRQYATEFGVDVTRFLGEVRKYKVDKHHPFITLDPNKCIACGRCVRTCSEILRVSALGFVYRGFRSVVKPSLEKRLLETNCISCGNCIAACPTGAISENVPFSKPGPWKMQSLPNVCNFCSLGCHLHYRVVDADTLTIGSADAASPNKGYLCLKGRFGYRYMLDKNRAVKPLLKKDGSLVECGWEEALAAAAAGLGGLAKKKGPGTIGISASPRLSNEELYLLQRLARAGLGTNQVASFSRILGNPGSTALKEMIGVSASTASLDDLANADLILVINAELSDESLIAELKIKEAQKRGAQLVTVSSYESKLVKSSDLWIDCKRSTGAILVAGLTLALIDSQKANLDFIKSRTEGFDEFKKSVSQLNIDLVSQLTGVNRGRLDKLVSLFSSGSQRVVVVYNQDHQWEKSRQDLEAVANLMLAMGRICEAGSGILLLSHYANGQGLLDMGVDTRFLPGQVDGQQKESIARIGKDWKTDLGRAFPGREFLPDLKSGEIKGLMVVGEDPLSLSENVRLFSGVSFLVVADYSVTDTAMAADVFIPLSLPIESDGTYTACDRRVQKANAIFPAKNGQENWQWILALAERLGKPFPFKSLPDVASEIVKVNPLYSNVMDSGGAWGEGMLADSFPTPSGKARFTPLALEMVPASRQAPVLLYSENWLIHKIKNKLVV